MDKSMIFFAVLAYGICFFYFCKRARENFSLVSLTRGCSAFVRYDRYLEEWCTRLWCFYVGPGDVYVAILRRWYVDCQSDRSDHRLSNLRLGSV